MSMGMHMGVSMHSMENVHPLTYIFFAILKPFLTENEKMDITLEEGINVMQLFNF